MIHLPSLIEDLAIILMTAAAVTLLCKFLKQPVVLGYLIAGLLLGPHVSFMPTVVDHDSIKVWAEIGVIFLLFGLGLEFSFKKLAKVGGSASITAFVEVIFMLGVGYATGKIMGWSNMDSLFLGGILSISSTTIIVRAFEELNFKGRKFVSLVFGVLIVEDLVAILLLVLLSTVAVTQTLSGSELLYSTGKLAFFLALWFLVGIYLIPIFLKQTKHLLSDETTLVVSIGLCLMMVIVATKVGFSPALGAFIMGSILAETREGKKIEHLMLPVRDLFAAVFFVSVGMMIDPNVLSQYSGVIITLTIVTILGKFISTMGGALISGRSFKNSMQAGLSLAQIGEFSFIIATLGLTLKVTSDFLYPIAVAVSAVTTFTTPYMIKYSDGIYAWIEGKLPKSTLDALKRYEGAVGQSAGQSVTGTIWKEYGVKIILNSVVVVGFGLLGSHVLYPLIYNMNGNAFWASIIACAITLAVSVPFLWAVMVGKAKETEHVSQVLKLKNVHAWIATMRVILGIILVGIVVSRFAPLEATSAAVFIIIAMLSVYLGNNPAVVYRLIEKRFISNFHDKDKHDAHNKIPELTPWEANLAEFVLSPYSELIAKTLAECELKEKYGLTVTMIRRGRRTIPTPNRDEILMPYDRLYIIGTDEELEKARQDIEVDPPDDEIGLTDTFGLESLLLTGASKFVNQTIRECGLRDEVSGLIVGLERQGQRILSPDSSMVLQADDLLWIVGDRNQIRRLSY